MNEAFAIENQCNDAGWHRGVDRNVVRGCSDMLDRGKMRVQRLTNRSALRAKPRGQLAHHKTICDNHWLWLPVLVLGTGGRPKIDEYWSSRNSISSSTK